MRRLVVTAPDPAAQLVQLGQAELVGALDDDGVGARHVDTKTTQHPILSLCALKSLNLLACGSSARHIILHDPRAEAQGVTAATDPDTRNAAAISLHEWYMATAEGRDRAAQKVSVRG